LKFRLSFYVVILFLASSSALPGAAPAGQWLGVLWTKGSVSVGGASVSSGSTILPGDEITTDGASSAWLRFRIPASTLLLADTQLKVLPSNSAPSLALNRGTMVVDEKVGDPVHVTVPGGYVLVKGDAANGAECELEADAKFSNVSVKRGLAEVHSQNAPVILHPGESFRVEAGPQAGSQLAGRIDQECPYGVILRQGETQEEALQVHEVVNLHDLVRTLQSGRARVELVDGSTLNMASWSSVKILKHDPQAQQTDFELTWGKVHANVKKITTPGGRFELHTNGAVIGTIDTSYVASFYNGDTEVCGVDGVTEVRSSSPKIVKTVRLHKGQCTDVVVGQAPTDPVHAPNAVADMLDQTQVQAGCKSALVRDLGQPILLGVGLPAVLGAAVAGVVLYNVKPTTPTTP
jgi:ferric-dicitrate binding protein FerR (iron transport regulator)